MIKLYINTWLVKNYNSQYARNYHYHRLENARNYDYTSRLEKGKKCFAH